MTEPTAPIALDRAAEDTRQRFGESAVALDDALLQRLHSVCAVVDTDHASRVEAGRDWWPLTIGWALDGETPAYPGVIARPATTGEVSAVLAACDEARVPATAMAGRSGVCGSSLPLFGGVALDLCGLAGIVGVDDESLVLQVRAGTFGNDLERDLRADHGLTLGHWPQSIDLSTVGGWLACRSAGQYSTRYGKIEDMVLGMEVVLADGRIIETGGRAPRSAVGPDLNQLFVGSEGTLGVITEASLRVRPVAPAERRAAYGFAGEAGAGAGAGAGAASFQVGLDVCRRVLRRGATPAVLRLYDHHEAKRSFDVVDHALLIVLDEGEPALVEATMALVAEECERAGAVAFDLGLVERWMQHRNDVSALEAAVRQGLTVDTVEIAARWSVLPHIYRDACAAVRALPGTFVISAHQSHAYTDGACLYFTFAGQSPTGDGDGYYRSVWDAVTHAALSNGGALSHHHGIGINRARYVRDALGPAFDVLSSIKDTLDPNGILNPGKLGFSSAFGEVTVP